MRCSVVFAKQHIIGIMNRFAGAQVHAAKIVKQHIIDNVMLPAICQGFSFSTDSKPPKLPPNRNMADADANSGIHDCARVVCVFLLPFG